MANLKDLIVNGTARIIGKTYSSEFVGNVTGNVTGNLTGNAATASKLGTATVGGDTKPIYLKAGVATAVSNPVIPLVSNGDMSGADVSTVQGAGVLLKDETTGTVWNIHTHAGNLRMYNGSTEKILSENGHTHSYAGSSSVGGPATDFAAEAGTASTDRYVYFAYDDTTTYNNPDSSKVTKGRAVVDSDFKYNPGTNTLTAGTFKGSLSGNAATATTADKTAYSLSVKDGASTPVAAIDNWNGSASKTLTIKGDSPIATAATTSTSTVTITHATSGVTAGTYRSVTVDTKGHVTGGTSPTTLEGYGITDAKVESGTITLGSNTITPLTAESTLAAGKVSGTLATSNIPDLDASKITSGTLSVDRMPSHTHTSITDGSMTLYAHNSNEVNFGGTNNSGTIFFGYRAMDSKPIPSTFVFGGTGSGSANVKAGKVWNAVFNDLADAIPVGEGDVLEAGYCYGFDGEHYTKTSEYMQKSYIGIHSDTFGFLMGHEEGKEKLNVAVSGFVLAYVDRDYEVGTPLTCTENGCLTEIKKEDKIEYPERIVATYWKNEPNEEWGPEGKEVKVNERRWVKVK